MADIARMESALRNAHKAGDVEAAKKIANALKAAKAKPEEGKGVLRRVDDFVRGAADMATFGFADEIAAGMGSLTGIGGEQGDYAGNVEEQRQRDDEGGVERFAGQMLGAVAIPGGAARTMRGAVGQGAVVGGAYGLGSGEGDLSERRDDALAGAALGGAAGGAVRGIANRFQTKAARSTVPTSETLQKSATRAYEAADKAGVMIRPESTAALTQAVKNDLAEFGYDAALQPGVKAVLDRLEGLQGQNVTLKGMDIIRRVAGNAARSSGDNASQRALASSIIDKIDDFVAGLGPEDVLGGNPREAINQIVSARELWSRMKRLQMVEDAMTKASRRAASTGSGGNIDNATRQNVRRLLDNPKTARGMTATEKEAAEKVVRGTRGQNAMRLGGKLSPTGNGLMTALTIGGTMANPLIGLASVAGIGAKTLAESMTQRNLQRLSEIIRSGGLSANELAVLYRSGQLEGPKAIKAIEALERRLQNRAAGVAATAQN